MKKIVIDIDPTGDFTFDLQGFHGKACAKIANEFLESSTTKTERLKREYHEATAQQTEVQKS
jgi:hypothetical protein